jgi:hypothetical protein
MVGVGMAGYGGVDDERANECEQYDMGPIRDKWRRGEYGPSSSYKGWHRGGHIPQSPQRARPSGSAAFCPSHLYFSFHNNKIIR